MFGIIDENGDLGRGEKLITAQELPVLALKAAHFLYAVAKVCLEHRFDEDKILKYAIETDLSQGSVEILNALEDLFPRGVRWYCIDGRRIFDVRGAGGGLVSSRICYLVCYPNKMEGL